MNSHHFDRKIDLTNDWFNEMLKYATINEPKDIAYMKGEKNLITWINNNKSIFKIPREIS